MAKISKSKQERNENHRTGRIPLDSFDHAILHIVQQDNQRTHAQLGEEIGLSPSSVRRRLARLRRAGVIRQDVALLDPDSVGISVIVIVTFQQESTESVQAFRQRMIDAPAVSQCYSVAGAVDYVLVVHAADLASYEAWSTEALMDDPAIRRYDTHIVWSRVKYTTALPVNGS